MLGNNAKKPIIISSAISLLFFVAGILIGNNSISGFIIGGMTIGFTSTDYKLGLKLGATSGFISGIIILLLNIALLIMQGANELMQSYITILIIYFIIEIIISSFGGALASLIKSEYMN